jgi:hypothetical protein
LLLIFAEFLRAAFLINQELALVDHKLRSALNVDPYSVFISLDHSHLFLELAIEKQLHQNHAIFIPFFDKVFNVKS